jgi:predicted NUDIX family NTP pyrophosphohydrolase
VAKQSAGILLYRTGDGELEVLLVHLGGPFWAKRDLGAWSIPKGECAEGEDPRACAAREFREELGAALPTTALVELGTVKQRGGKLVIAFAAEGDFDPADLKSNTFVLEWPPRSGSMREFEEVDRVGWFGPAEAREKLVPAQAAFVGRLLEHLGRR